MHDIVEVGGNNLIPGKINEIDQVPGFPDDFILRCVCHGYSPVGLKGELLSMD